MSGAPLSRIAKKFARAEEGTIVVIFAIAILPILCFVGAAVDYTRAVTAKTSMQAALDSTALMLAKDLSTKVISASDIKTKGEAYFAGLHTSKQTISIEINATYTPPNGSTRPTVLVTGKGAIKSDFMQIAGYPTLGFSVNSTSTWGNNRLRVALVLDNSGSMDKSNKLTSLKSASKSLVAQLSQLEGQTGDVYISVVPFASEVNVGTSNVNASWLRWDLWDPQPNQYKDSKGKTAYYCSAGSTYSWFSMALCLGHGYKWSNTVGSPAKSQWTGCVSDRDKNYDISSTPPSGGATNFPADQDQYCPKAALLPLTSNWTTINKTIDSMTASGATNQTIGLQWGWLSLLQQAPLYAPAEDPNLLYQHVIVLFTDGLNTVNRWNGDGANISTDVDARMGLLCTAVKASKVTVFAVHVDTDGDGQSKVLPNCAGAGNYYFLKNAADIANTFAAIGTEISKLRVSK